MPDFTKKFKGPPLLHQGCYGVCLIAFYKPKYFSVQIHTDRECRVWIGRIILKSSFRALLWHLMRTLSTGLRSALILAVLVSGWSCHNDKRPELFKLTYPPPPIEFDIPPGLNTFDTHVYTISPISSQYAAHLNASGYTEDDVASIEAGDAYVTARFGDVNLDYIRRISVYIYDPFNPSDKTEFFYLDPVPYKNQTSIRLFPGIADIRSYVERGFFGLELRFDFRETTPVLAEMKFEFELRVLGQ